MYVYPLLIVGHIELTSTQIRLTPDPPSPRMSWENCRAVPSQQLAHVLCGKI